MLLIYKLLLNATTYVLAKTLASDFGDDYYLQVITPTLIEEAKKVNDLGSYPDPLSAFLYSGQHWTFILAMWVGLIANPLTMWTIRNEKFRKQEILPIVGLMMLAALVAPYIGVSPLLSAAIGFFAQGAIKYAYTSGRITAIEKILAVRGFGTISALADSLVGKPANDLLIPNDNLPASATITKVKPVLEVEVVKPPDAVMTTSENEINN